MLYGENDMKKPEIICHMLISLDGKVTGSFLFRPECEAATEEYYRINRNFGADGFICGRVTMEGSFTAGYFPDLAEYEPINSADDYLPPDGNRFFAVAFDPSGKLGWKNNVIVDDDPGYGGARIIEVLTEKTDPRYLGYLQSLEIPYVFGGKTEIDIPLVLDKIAAAYSVETLLLEGGSIINGYFQEAGVIDKISLVSVPVVADSESKPLFYNSVIENYELTEASPLCGSSLWLRYTRKTAKA